MSDNDLIRRGDAENANCIWLKFGPMGDVESVSSEPMADHKRYCEQDAIAALPAVVARSTLASTERDGFGRPTDPAQPHVAASNPASVRYCPICDIAECATHRPLAASQPANLETCGRCMGSGYDGHPDSGALCIDCNGSGGVAASQPAETVAEIDLRSAMMEELEKAAADSPWVPKEYYMNEVISDCCAFLREDRDATVAASQPADPARVMVKPLIYTFHDRGNYGVCIGGRWHGWVMVRHPDGHWVSDRLSGQVDPAQSGNNSILAAIDVQPDPRDAQTTAALKAIAKGPQMGEVMETWIYYAMATAQEALDKAKQKDNTSGTQS